jgi:hypothetical protein
LASFEKPFPSHNHLFLLLDLLKTSFYCVFADFHSLLSEIFSYRSEHDIVCLFLYLLTPVLSLFLAFIFLLFWSWGECFYIEGFSNIWKSCVAWRDSKDEREVLHVLWLLRGHILLWGLPQVIFLDPREESADLLRGGSWESVEGCPQDKQLELNSPDVRLF